MTAVDPVAPETLIGSAVVLDLGIKAVLGLTMTNFTLYPTLDTMNFNSVSAVSSNIGHINTLVIKTQN